MDQIAPVINQKSLREQVYEYLSDQMNGGTLTAGCSINITALSQQLGISKTPLREALLQLEVEGLVTIYPRRGVMVNKMSRDEIRHVYEIIGFLESSILLSVTKGVDGALTSRMKQISEETEAAALKKDFESHHDRDIEFHNILLSLSNNEQLHHIVRLLRLRLYDFPRRDRVELWDLCHWRNHRKLVELIEKDDLECAAKLLREVHWS